MSVSAFFKRIADKLEQGLIISNLDAHLDKVAEDARTGAKNKRIESAIFIDAFIKRENKYIGKVGIDLDIAPEGRAFELGSGVHSESGEKYPIVPKGPGYPLRFFWDKAHPLIPKDSEGRVILWSVQHPGVAAEPTLGPALEKNRITFSNLVFKVVRAEIEIEFRQTIKEGL